MEGDGIARHTLNGYKKSVLKRGETYVYDTMNLLYSMCFVSSIEDLLNQSPPVPTREIVGDCYNVFEFLRFFRMLVSPLF